MEIAPFDRSHTSSYSIVTMELLYRFRDAVRYWSKNANFSYALPFNLHDHPDALRISILKILTQTIRVPKQLDGAKYCRKVQPCE